MSWVHVHGHGSWFVIDFPLKSVTSLLSNKQLYWISFVVKPLDQFGAFFDLSPGPWASGFWHRQAGVRKIILETSDTKGFLLRVQTWCLECTKHQNGPKNKLQASNRIQPRPRPTPTQWPNMGCAMFQIWSQPLFLLWNSETLLRLWEPCHFPKSRKKPGPTNLETTPNQRHKHKPIKQVGSVNITNIKAGTAYGPVGSPLIFFLFTILGQGPGPGQVKEILHYVLCT